MSFKINFLGGSDEVGASCLLLEMGGQRILVDAGIRVSPKARDGLSGELLPDLSPLSMNSKIDAVIVTHAHADHIGAVPLVLGSLPNTPVYTTPATISLMSVMFRDALRIMDKRMEAEGELPHYDQLQVQRVESACRPTDWRQEFSINGSVNVTFYKAGHIPGAVSVYLQSDEGSILISGDLSFSPMRATPMAEIPPVRPDVLVLESTYGGKLHANRLAEERRLIEAVKRVLERGGRVLIPAFALGRAQEVALILDNAIATRKLAPVPVYMDGMTRSITQVFERFPDYLSKDLTRHLEEEMDLFKSNSVEFVKSITHRNDIAHSSEPMVIISSSGMLTGGASPRYAQELVGSPENAIFITGYQDEESPGKALQRLARDGSGTVVLYGKKYELHCEIGTYSLSAHADENELTQYAAQLEPRQTYMVHGDSMARERMRDLIRQRRLGVSLVKLGQEIELTGTEQVGRRKDAPLVPTFNIAPITALEELDVGLPLFDAEGNIYVRSARKAIRKAMPPETGLRKIRFKENERQIKLYFDFPAVAAKKFAEQIAMVQQLIGWQVVLNDTVNMMALQTFAKNNVPGLLGRVSIHMAEQVVEAKLKAIPDNWQEIQTLYRDETGFRLIPKGSRTESVDNVLPIAQERSSLVEPKSGRRLEINEAYAMLKMHLRDKGLYKAGIKGDTIVLSFITPEKGRELGDSLQEMANLVGYRLDIHPHANQNGLITLVQELCVKRDIYLVKNPSVKTAETAIVIEPSELPSQAIADELVETFHAETAWQLEIKAPSF